MVKRRKFIKDGVTALSGAGLTSSIPFIMPNRHRGIAPSDQINIGLIGCRSRGFAVLKNHLKVPGVNCVAICDIDESILSKRGEELENSTGIKPVQYKEFRRLIADKNLDAVIIGTPDHWHCLQTIYACEMGLDVYVEKPMANSIEECNQMVKAARRYDRVVQVGQQQRSSEVFQSAIAFVQSGKLGRVNKANIWANFNYGLGPMKRPNSPTPDGVDYNLFLGPAPLRAFNESRFHGSWRFFWDYGGGLMTDWGVHLLDMGLWARDIMKPANEVLAYGSQLELPDRDRDTHDTLTAIFPYDDYMIEWQHNAGIQTGPYGQPYGISFIGENGTLVADRSRWFVVPEGSKEEGTQRMEEFGPTKGENGHSRHPNNFLDCIKTREDPACPVEIGRAVAVCAHMANIAVRSNANRLQWDDLKNKFIGNRLASRYIKPNYRKPWVFPDL